MSKTFWIQPVDTEVGKWQQTIKELTGSESFCVLPWIHMATRPNGDMRICCVANASGADTGDYTVGLVKKENGEPINFSNTSPKEAFNSEYMRSVRELMLNGSAPASCKKCYDEEAKGIASKRIWETASWHLDNLDIPQLVAKTNEDYSIPFELKYLDLRLGHTCNLKCIMCSPHDSSLWVTEHKKVYPIFQSPLIKKQMSWDGDEFNNKWHETHLFWDDIFEQIPNITQLYFAGGEPLMSKEHKKLLQYIIEQGYSQDITLRYNTNGILVGNAIIDIWTQFKKVKVAVSMDAIGPRLNYIRYPTEFSEIEKNLHILDNTPDNIEVNIACAVQILNIKHIPDFIKWKVNQQFKKVSFGKNIAGYTMGGGLMGVHLLWIPTFLSLRILPFEDKREITQLFRHELKQWLWENYTTDDEFWHKNPHGWKRWESIIDWMNSEDQSHIIPDFVEYINTMDSERNTDFNTIFPELKHLNK